MRAAYDRSISWPERIYMAQWWSDNLEILRQGGFVVSFRQVSASEVLAVR